MKKQSSILLMLALLLALPFTITAIADDPVPGNVPITVKGIINSLFNLIWPIVVALIIIMFILAGFEYLTARGDAAKVEKANRAVIWGVAGVVVILLAFSIITILRLTIGGGAL